MTTLMDKEKRKFNYHKFLETYCLGILTGNEIKTWHQQFYAKMTKSI